MLRQKQIRHFKNADVSTLRALATTFETGELAFVEDTSRLYKFNGTDFVQVLGSALYRATGIDFTTAEPAAPTSGDTYWAEGTGAGSVTAVAVTDQNLYEYDSVAGAWIEMVPVAGDLAATPSNLYIFDGTSWVLTGGVEVREELVATAQDTLPNLANPVEDVLDVRLVINDAVYWSGATTPPFTVTNGVADASITWSAANAGFNVETYDDIYAEYTARSI